MDETSTGRRRIPGPDAGASGSLFALLAVLIVAAGAMGAGLLALRHQRYALMHEITQLHGEMGKLHQELWSQQIQISGDAQPGDVGDDSMRTDTTAVDARPVDTGPRSSM